MSASGPSSTPLSTIGQHAALPDERTRRQLMLDHPLVRGAPIMTPPVERAALACKIAFFQGDNAFTLVAPPGRGRRSAAFIIAQSLRMAFPSLTILAHTFGRQAETTLRDEWRSLVLSMDPQAPKDSVSGLRHRSMVAAANHVRRADGNGAILLVLAHMERLAPEAATVLLDFGELLATRGYKLRIFSVAEQGEFSERFGRNDPALKQRELDALVGKLHVLEMIAPAKDLASVLQEIDLAEFPAGCQWTQFFVPKAYAAGLRLENCREALATAIGRMQTELGLHPTTRQLFAAIRSVLGQATLRDGADLQLSEVDWFDALSRASFSSMDRINQLSPSSE